MTTAVRRFADVWWTDQEPSTRAVITLASLDDAERADITALLDAGLAEHVEWIAEQLATIDRCGWDHPAAVLGDYEQQVVHGPDLDVACDRLADELRGDVVLRAQLVASLNAARRPVGVPA